MPEAIRGLGARLYIKARTEPGKTHLVLVPRLPILIALRRGSMALLRKAPRSRRETPRSSELRALALHRLKRQ